MVLVEEDGSGTVGANYSLHSLKQLLGYDLIQVNHSDVIGLSAQFEESEVVIHGTKEVASTNRSRSGSVARYKYDRVVAYRLAPDGTVSLLRRLPDDLLLGTRATALYNPLQLLQPGPLRDLPYFRYPKWIKPPGDVIRAEDGFLLGAGWSGLEAEDGRLFRRLGEESELVVNPLGQTLRTLLLEVEPMPAGGSCTLEVRSLEGKVLCRTALRGREYVSLMIPTDPARVSMVTLWARPDGDTISTGSAVELRVFAPAGARRLPAAPVKRDITGVGVRLGRNWHPLENHTGEGYRWVATGGAEVVLGNPGTATDLLVELGAGPGLGGKSGRLRAIGPDGTVLHEESFFVRKRIHVPIPPELPRGAVVKLEVIGGGLPVSPSDPRILDALVYRCQWVTDDITGVGVRLGRNWHPLENHTGEGYRWVATGGAEVVLGNPGTATDLLVELGAGPGLGGKSGRLRAIGPDGTVLHEESFFAQADSRSHPARIAPGRGRETGGHRRWADGEPF